MKNVFLAFLPVFVIGFYAQFSSAQEEVHHNKNRPEYSEKSYYHPKPDLERQCFPCAMDKSKEMCKYAHWHNKHFDKGDVIYLCDLDNHCRGTKLRKDLTVYYFEWKYGENVCASD